MVKNETAEEVAKKVIALNEDAKKKERMGLFSQLHVVAGAVSAIWIFYAIQYLVTSGWWSNRFAMSPPEFVGFISGMVLPLVLIWLVVAYIDRSRQFQRDSQMLQTYMEQLVSPTEEGAAYTKALTDTLRVYVKEFKDVFNDVTESSGTIASDLKDRIVELKKVQGDLKNNTKKVVEELDDRAQSIVAAAKTATENSKDTAEDLKWQIENLNIASEQSNMVANNLGSAVQDYVEKFKIVSDSLAAQTDSLAEDLNNRTEMLYKASDVTKDALVGFSTTLADQISTIEETTDRVKSRTDNIGVIVDEKANRLAQVFEKQEQGLLNMTQMIDEKASIIDETLKNQSETLDTELERVVSRFRLIEDGLSIQTGELVNVSDRVIEDLNEIYAKFDNHRDGLVKATEDVSAKIQDVGVAYDLRAEKLETKATEIDENINNLSKTLEDKFHSYTALADGLGERMTSVGVSTAKEVDNLKSTIDNIKSTIGVVKEDIKKQSEDLVDLSNVIGSQGKMAEASIAQQQRALSSTSTRIEEVKNELRTHIEELESFYDRLDDNANNYLKKTRETMSNAQTDVANLAKHTSDINSSIEQELINIADTNSLTLSSSEKVTTELGKHSDILADIMQTMQNRTNDIYKLFTSQKSVIEGSAKEIQSKVGQISVDFENNLALLMKNANEIVSEVSDISKELQTRAQDIDGLFIRQDDMLNESAEKLNENSAKVLDVIRANTQQLDNDLDRIRSRISLIEDSLSTQVKDLIDASDESITKVSALSGELARQSDTVADISKLSINNMHNVVEALVGHSGNLVVAIEGVEAQSKVSAHEIEAKTKGMESIISELGNKSQAIVVNINDHIDAMDKGGLKLQNQTKAIQNVLGTQIEELTDVSNVVSTNTRLSEASIISQCNILKSATEKTSESIKEIGGLLKQNTSDILGSVTRVNKELEYVSDSIQEKSDSAHKIVEATIKNTQDAAASLEEQYKALESTSEKAIISISSVVSQLKNNALSIEGASDSSVEQIRAVSDTLNLQKIQMDNVSDEAMKSIRIFAGTIKERAEEFGSTTDEIERRIEGFILSMRELAKEFEVISNDSVAKVDVTSSHLRSTITEVSTNSSRIAGNVKDATTDFVKQSEALNESSQLAINRLESLLMAMRESSTEVEDVNDKLSANALKVGGALSRHIQALISASNTAEEQVKKLDKKSMDVSHDNFLKEASFIIEKLQAVAVDITRIFQPNVEEELWKKYYNGDRSAFMRYLIKALDKHQVSSIRKLFENDNDFRDYVAGYMSNFEAILDRAKLSDRSDVIIAILTGSDVGRLYMILARALGNKE